MGRGFLAMLGRDLRLAYRQGSDVVLALAFFIIAASLFPLGVGPDRLGLAKRRSIVSGVCSAMEVVSSELGWASVVLHALNASARAGRKMVLIMARGLTRLAGLVSPDPTRLRFPVLRPADVRTGAESPH